MRKDLFSRAASLVSTLIPSEKNILLNVIEATRNPHSKKSKLSELFKELDQNSSHGKKANRKLLELLEDRILDSLIMDVNLLRQGKYTNTESTSVILQKESIKSRLLYSRGIVKRAYQIAETCINRAKETESFDIILGLLHQQLSMICIHQNQQDFFHKMMEIDHFESCRSLKMKAIRLYRELKIKKYHGVTENLDFFVESSLKQLYQFQSKVSFEAIDFITLYFEMEKYEMSGDIFSSQQTIVKLYEKCNPNSESPLIFNIYELVYEQARLHLELGQIDECCFLLEKCISHLPIENFSCQRSLELLFLLKFIKKDLHIASEILSQLKESEYFEKLIPPRDKARWTYYEACLFFSLNDPKRCLRVLSTTSLTGIDALDNIRVRYLRTMAFIELEHLDQADRQIESTRKFIERNNLVLPLEETGLIHFFECLTALKYCGYDFHRLATKMPELENRLLLIKNNKLNTSQLRDWLMEYGSWIRKKMEPSSNNSDYDIWHCNRREYYFNTGQVKRIYIN